MPYHLLSRTFPTCEPPAQPQRIVLIRPCCIGDVVMATATLTALRRAYPQAHITWAVGGWSQQVVIGHPDCDAILDTGNAAHPAATWAGFRQFVRQLRGGNFDLAVSLVRSPKTSAAVLMSGIPYRAGIDSAGRGFGYNIRAPLDPLARRHEVDIYLDVVRTLGVDADHFQPNVTIPQQTIEAMRQKIPDERFIVVNPSGGKNPGAQMDAKRYPPHLLREVIHRIVEIIDFTRVVIVTGPGDDILAASVAEGLRSPHTIFAGNLTFLQIGALAQMARLYIGNDTGLTHYAAAAGGKTAMLMGPTDPQRYGVYSGLSLWKDYPLPAAGFAGGAPPDWNWARDGIAPQDATAQIIDFYR